MELASRARLDVAQASLPPSSSSSRDASDLYVMCMDAHLEPGAAASGRVVCGLSGGALAAVDACAGRPGLSLVAGRARAHGGGGVAGVVSLSGGRALSCGADGAARMWDFRAGASARGGGCAEWALGEEVTCIACDEEESLMACGTERGVVLLFDLRMAGSAPCACITEAHTEPVCQVSFDRAGSPGVRLMTAGVDGLLCVFDASGASSARFKEEERYVSVLNSQSSVAVAGIFGARGDKAFTITHDQTVSVFDWVANTSLAYSRSAREEATAAASAGACGPTAGVDYLISAGCDGASGRLLIAAGSAHGDVAVFPIRDYDGGGGGGGGGAPGADDGMDVDDGGGAMPMGSYAEPMFGAPVAHLRNGHGGQVVRCALFSPYGAPASAAASPAPAVRLLTGCEGGCLALWDADGGDADGGDAAAGGRVGGGGGGRPDFKARRRRPRDAGRRPY